MSLMLLSAGCEPTSITEARNQLGRGPERIVQFTIPIAHDSVAVEDFLDSTVVTPEGLVGIEFDPETLTVKVGEKLKFDNLSFSQFTFGYKQMLETAEDSLVLTLNASSFTPAPGFRAPAAAPSDTIRFVTPAGSAVLSTTVQSGRVVRRLTQNSGCSVTISASLVDSLGNTVVSFPPTVVASGATVTDSVTISNATMVGYVRVSASGSLGGLCLPNPGATASLAVTFRPLTLSSVTLRNLNETFNQPYAPLASEPRITAVDTVEVQTGRFTLTVQNRLPVQFKALITLRGVLRASGDTLRDSLIVAAAPGNGTTTSGTLTLNLDSVRIAPGSVVARVEGRATATQATIDTIVTKDAIVVTGGGNLQIERLSGKLTPCRGLTPCTPELTVSPPEEFQEIKAEDFDLGDLEDAVKQATLKDAKIQLGIVNSSGAPLMLDSFTLAVVELTSTDTIYQTDAQGAITVAVVDSPSVTTLTIPRNSPKSVTLQTARVLDRVIDLVLDDKRAALVASGNAVVGDGAQSVITSADLISLRLGLTVALDFDIPASGVTFSKTSVTEGAGLDTLDRNQIAQRVDTASATAIVRNGMPFGVRVHIAMVPLPLPDTLSAESVFKRSDRVEIGPVSLAAAQVDASGRVTTPQLDTATVRLTGIQSKVLLGNSLTAAIRVTLLPSATSTRGAIRATDKVIIRASGSVKLRSGGAP